MGRLHACPRPALRAVLALRPHQAKHADNSKKDGLTPQQRKERYAVDVRLTFCLYYGLPQAKNGDNVEQRHDHDRAKADRAGGREIGVLHRPDCGSDAR